VKNKEGPQNTRRERRWLRPKEAAERLDCHIQTIYSSLLRGDLPGARIKGIGWRLDWLELQRRIESEIMERARSGQEKGRTK